MKRIRTALLALLFVSGSALALDYDRLVREATARSNNEFLDHWSFSETRSSPDEIRVASYDPSRGPDNAWKLEALNGETPSDDAISGFREEKARRRAEREADETENGLFEMITPGSLELLEETSDSWRFSFQPRDEDDEAFMKHVAGELRILKKGRYVESLSLKSRGSFKPRTGVKIDSFEMRMSFSEAGEAGPIVPVSLKSSVRGKAFLVATIDEEVVVEFSDYQPANQEAMGSE